MQHYVGPARGMFRPQPFYFRVASVGIAKRDDYGDEDDAGGVDDAADVADDADDDADAAQPRHQRSQ